MKIKKCSAVLVMLILTLSMLAHTTAYAEAVAEPSAAISTNSIPGWPLADDIASTAGIVLDTISGNVLYGKNIDQPLYPGSAIKIMTTLLAIENSDLSDIVTMTSTGVSGVTDGGAHIAAQLDEEFTMEQCLYAIMLASANDIALQVAEHVGGSLDGFIQLMNARAAELGCTNTVFTNPTGLTDENQHSTAHDLALIMQAAIENPTFRTICRTIDYNIPATNKSGGTRVLSNKFALLNPTSPGYFEGCLGGKEGFTSASGSTLVTAAEKNDMTLIAVVLQGTSEETPLQACQLLNYGFHNFHYINLGRDDFDVISGGIVLSPVLASPDSFVTDEVPEEDHFLRTYYYNGIPMGTAILAPPSEEEKLDFDGEANFKAAVEFSADRSMIPYYVIGGIGFLLILFLLILMIKVIRS